MSSDELVGLLLTVALLGAVFGAVLASVVALRRDRTAELRTRHVDAYAQWLAARMTLTRASISFVAAFRALAAEQRDSVYFSLRQEEAQRARNAWCDAVRDLDRAEAVLVTWSDDAAIRERLSGFDRVSPNALQSVINGDQAQIDGLVRRLRNADLRSTEFVRFAVGQINAHRSAARELLTRSMTLVSVVVDHWSRR